MKKLRRLLSYAALGVLLVATVILAAWYQIDGQPLAVADEYLQGEGYSAQQSENGDWFFQPTQPNGYGIVILHGALIKPQSYSKSAAFFARQGFRVWIPYGTFRLSILSASRIAEQLAMLPEQQWFMIGHSMGGFTALTVQHETTAHVPGVAIWAGSMPEDFTAVTVPLFFVAGSADKLLPEERYMQAKKMLPAHTVHVLIPGANHKNFALYSHQFFDGEASIPNDSQIDQANTLTLEFFESLLN